MARRVTASTEPNAGLLAASLRNCLDYGNEFVPAVTLATTKLHQLLYSGDHCASLRSAGNSDCLAAAELQQTFLAQRSQCPENGVCVHAKYRGKVLGLRDPLAGTSFPIGDRSPDVSGNLFVERCSIGAIYRGQREGVSIVAILILLDRIHDANDSSFMVALTDRHTTESVVTSDLPADVQALFKEAKRRRRRRRIYAGLVFLVIVLLMVGLATVSRRARPTVGPITSTAPITSLTPTGIPGTYVAHVPTTTGDPGTIEVVDSASGQVIRTLGSAYDPYLQNGFQLSPDRSTLYYTRLDQPAQTIQIIAVPLNGDPSRVVALGVDPQLSPDGRSMAYEPYGKPHSIAIMTLANGWTISTQLPTSNQWQTDSGISWLPDSRHLLVTRSTPVSYGCDSPFGEACRPPPSFPKPSIAFLEVATNRVQQWSRAPTPKVFAGERTTPTLEGPGGQSGTVMALSNAGSSASSLLTIDVETGRVIVRAQLPKGTSFLARDRSGSHLILSVPSGTEKWTPGSGSAQPLGPAFSEAAW